MDEQELQKIRDHEADLERLRGMRPIDDTLMRRMFKNNVPLAEMVLRIILEKPDLQVTSIETQSDMKRVTGARSICLDAEATDSDGKKYDIEVQKASAGARPKRARYHSSVMDIENLDASQSFEELPETYVIFITENDVYKKGEPFYRIERMNLTTNQPFEDEAHIVFVNGAYEGEGDFGNLMHDFRCAEPEDMLIDLMREQAFYYKKTVEGVNEMCQAMEDLRVESTQRAVLKNILALMETTKWTFEQALANLKIPSEEWAVYKSMLTKTNAQ